MKPLGRWRVVWMFLFWGFVALWARQGFAAEDVIVNGGFETGDFTGWTVELHPANPPAAMQNPPPTVDVGAQVLTESEVLYFDPDSQEFRGTPVPEGQYYALVSSMPGSAEFPCSDTIFPECPSSIPYVPSGDPMLTDFDRDGKTERDVTRISQKVTVDRLPAFLTFQWSFLNSEMTDELHDDFYVTLLPEGGDPVDDVIRVLTVTAGNCEPPSYGGNFDCLPPEAFDDVIYEVFTEPAGGPGDCHRADAGRTAFRRTYFEIPAPGTYTLSFVVGDDGGDGCMDSGVLLDDVRLIVGQIAPVSGPAGKALLALALVALGGWALARRFLRSHLAARWVLVAGLLGASLGTIVLASRVEATVRSRSASRSPGVVRLAARTPVPPSPNPTREPTPTSTPNVS